MMLGSGIHKTEAAPVQSALGNTEFVINEKMQEARDVALRFLTVVFMHHEREVELTQLDNDLLIEPIENEAYE